MNLLFGSLKLEHDTLADAVATLDPTNKFLVKAIPRLSTLYNIFEGKDEMESIGALAKAAASEDPETHTKLTKFFVVVFGKVARPRTKIRAYPFSPFFLRARPPATPGGVGGGGEADADRRVRCGSERRARVARRADARSRVSP